MGVVGAVVDAFIGWLMQSLLGSFFTDKMEAWARGVGLADDVENLKFEMRNVQMVLAAAERTGIENKPLVWSLGDLKSLLFDAQDVMDELAYYRLRQQIEQGDGCTNPEKSPTSSSTPSVFQRACSTASPVVSLISHGRKRKREEDPRDGCTNPETSPVSSSTPSLFQRACSTIVAWTSHGWKMKREEEPIQRAMLPYEIKCEISERIKAIVNRLHRIGMSVQNILQLEILNSIAAVAVMWGKQHQRRGKKRKQLAAKRAAESLAVSSSKDTQDLGLIEGNLA